MIWCAYHAKEMEIEPKGTNTSYTQLLRYLRYNRVSPIARRGRQEFKFTTPQVYSFSEKKCSQSSLTSGRILKHLVFGVFDMRKSHPGFYVIII
jgi:hypothetical protein